MPPVPVRRLLAAVALGASLPLAVLTAFPSRLDGVISAGAYLAFHNTAEFFSIMVALSLFGVGWFAYDQSKDRHALFLGTAFLAVGLVDFMHAMSNAAMPAFLTPNSTNKSTQYWVAARLIDAAALLASAFVHPDRPVRGLTKRNLLAAALGVSALVFAGVTFFPTRMPATFVPGAGLTAVKVGSEYLVIAFLVLAFVAYWRRMRRTGNRLLVYYLAAFVVAICGEVAFASYTTGFDTYNVLGHLYKVVAFYLVYRGAFATSVAKPYVQLSRSNERLRVEIDERNRAEERIRALNAELERRVLERTAALSESEERWRKLIEAANEGIWIGDAEGRTTYVNAALARMLGYVPEEMLGRSMYDFMDEEARALARRQLERRRAGHRDHYEQRLLRKDGSILWVMAGATSLRDKEGTFVATMVALLDITEQKRAEETLREASRRKDEFLGMLSHELRNPLAPIRNSVYVLERANQGTEQAARARAIIRRQTEHLARLVDDLLDVTRIERGKIELRRTRVDLRDVVLRAAEDFGVPMHARGVALRMAVPDAPVWADADATRITQVVGNLLHNAAKFTSAGGEVVLSLATDGGEAEIRVRDTGAGIDRALLPHVFEPFVQGERALAGADGGLGLGLALVKGVTELHGGSVRAESGGTGKGAAFTVRLPLAGGCAAEAGEAHAPDASAGAARGGRRRRVLVVDDNSDAAESLAEIVKMLGHAAEVAFDGPSAIEKARANPPNVVICDIGLPGMSGYDVARLLRARAPADGLRLIAMSGYAQPEHVRRAIDSGFDQHLAKPCDPAEIARLLA